MSLSDRVDQLDVLLFSHVQADGISVADQRSLLALHASVAARGEFSYLEVGSNFGASLQSFIADPRCRKIVSIDQRDRSSPGELTVAPDSSDSHIAHMLGCLSGVPEADLEKLVAIEASTEELDPAELSADLCFIHAEDPNAALRDARFCCQVIGVRGVIVFNNRKLVGDGIRQFLSELRHCRAYPLAHDLFVVEINVPSLLPDPRVKARVPRKAWLVADRFRAMRPALWLAAMVAPLRASLLQRMRPMCLEAYGSLRTRLPRRRPPQYLAVCAIFRDEAAYLPEWVAFHRLQGVERFWLYDNLSTDNWRDAIAPEIDSGIVTVTSWPDESGSQQLSAYTDCLRRHRKEAQWITFIDLDEFLFSPTGRQLPEVLQRFSMHPAVVANWRVFGTNGHRTRPKGLVIENYLAMASDARWVNQHVKVILQPRLTARVCRKVHTFEHYGSAVGEDHKPQIGPRREPPTADLLRINHYFTKSEEEWHEHKLARSPATGVRRNLSRYALPPEDERNETILRFLPALKDALAHRTTDPHDPCPTRIPSHGIR